MNVSHFKLWNFSQPNIRTLHLTWFAFFLTFMVWFSHAPLKPLIMATFDMTIEQWKALLILNVALTIPARIVIGILVDRFGPRATYSVLLLISGTLCLAFASARSTEQLAFFRFLLGFTGAGFVIGIRMVGEWFPARHVGLAEGIYGGWGNFGSAAAAFILPTLALLLVDGPNGWRYAIGCTGVLAICYGIFFYWRARDTPKGAVYFKPKKSGGLEVTSRRDFILYLAMNIPMYAILALLAWKLSPAGVSLLSQGATYGVYLVLLALFIFQTSQIYRVNKDMLKNGTEEHQRYSFRQVAILDWAYFVTFGSELAVVSMLPAFFLETFTGLSLAQAGALGAAFAFMNLVARPGGGYISDRFGRRRSMSLFVAGTAAGYFALSQINAEWSVLVSVLAVMACSFFVQAGEGAVFAMVPLIKRRLTGQIAGMAGAYGNVGAVTFLTLYSFVDASTFFMIISASAVVLLGLVQFLREPQGHMTEIMADGTVQRIELT
jgi:NNP family nitrate/nitrite transporter-like MFS transporter